MSNPSIFEILPHVKAASKALRTSSVTTRNQVLSILAKKLTEKENEIIQLNLKDLAELKPDQSAAFRDRLTLNKQRIAGLCESLRQVSSFPDPIGELVESKTLANGLLTKKIRSPLGVIFMIFESRPNVAIEAFALALKSGNALILRGGKESQATVGFFYTLMREALVESGLPIHSLVGITDPDRSIVLDLLKQKKYIDVVVPRGGESLIEFVVENSKIPIIKNDRGMCHIYAHSDADLKITLPIILNAKKQRPGVCNAVETILIHESIAQDFIPRIYATLSDDSKDNPVDWFLCAKSAALLSGKPHTTLASEKSFETEYLDYKLNCKIVSSVDEAIEHIENYGSKHSESILTQSEITARKFQNEIDAAAVYWNASTRFTDGFELGLGGELGISTQKLHVRGPVGLKELTSIRWVMDGTGQIR